MQPLGPLLAWVLSVACLAGEVLLGLRVPGASRLALTLVFFIALAGVPRAEPHPRPAVQAAGWVCLSLPPLAFACALDLRAGLAPEALAGTAVLGLLLCFFGALAAARAPRSPYPLVWVLLVPAAAALLLALRYLSLPGSEPAPLVLRLLALVHPLAWLWRAPGELAPWPLLSILVLLACAGRRRLAA